LYICSDKTSFKCIPCNSDISDNYETPAVFGRHGRKIKAPSWKKDYFSPSATKRTQTTDEAETPSKKRDFKTLI
jgi:hypothetical protein